MQAKRTTKTVGCCALLIALVAVAPHASAGMSLALAKPSTHVDACDVLPTSGKLKLEVCLSVCTYDSDDIAAVFQNINFGGSCLKLSGISCTGVVQSLASMPSGWNDVVSSAEVTFVGEGLNCSTIQLFEHSNFNGATVSCSTDCAYVGDSMNDKTSSLKVF